MLSRVAERIYWLGRYMERTENTARLVNVNSNLLLDLPKGVRVGWGSLVRISGTEEYFNKDIETADERTVLRFILLDRNNPSSLLNSVGWARENARITREIIPSEAWELVNDLYLKLKEHPNRLLNRRDRNLMLQEVIGYIQQLTGLLAGCMSQNHAYEFIRLGCNLERSDMTSRIVDVGSTNLLSQVAEVEGEASEPYEDILWMSVLSSLSAYQMYRQHVLDRVNAEDVVTFLLQDQIFPRAVSHCLGALEGHLHTLPNNDEPLRAVASARRKVRSADISELLAAEGLHDYIDSLQQELGEVHREIAQAWFLPVPQT